MRTIDWVDGAVEIVDQTVLPGELRILRLHTVPELVAAIQSLAVRGAGALAGVVASETRPLLQGARLTSWELSRWGIEHRVAVDSAGPFLMARGEVDGVILGADRICANGDVINKIGTYSHALGARRAGLPFLVVAPESTVDTGTPDGGAVEIEDRGPQEVL